MNNENLKIFEFEDIKLSTRNILIVLWIALLLLHIYGHFYSIFRNDILYKYFGGYLGHQIISFIIGFFMIFPILIIIANLFIKISIVRFLNIIVGIIQLIINILYLIEEIWVNNIMFCVLGGLIAVLIIIKSIKWPKIKTYLKEK